MAGSVLFAYGALAEPLRFAVPARYPATIFQQVLPDRGEADGIGSAEVPPHLRRQVIENPTNEVPATIVIDTEKLTSIWFSAAARHCVTESA